MGGWGDLARGRRHHQPEAWPGSRCLLRAAQISKRNPRNWLGEAVDQRKIVRDYVKWDHEVSKDEDISSALREAFRVASAEPCGPVYLTLAEGVSMERPGENLVLAPAETTVDL